MAAASVTPHLIITLELEDARLQLRRGTEQSRRTLHESFGCIHVSLERRVCVSVYVLLCLLRETEKMGSGKIRRCENEKL